MHKSEIRFQIELDDERVPERIEWEATESGADRPEETKAVSIALWDQANKNTLRIDLWTKEMPIIEMKRFYVDCIGGLAQSVINSTGDTVMAGEMNDLVDRLVQYLETDIKNTK